MSHHFLREIEVLKKKILSLSALVEESVQRAVKSISAGNAELADAVVDGDIKIDQMEVEVEEECLKILALHQPVAVDLRFIVAVLKMNSDLERIGDLSVNIAERAIFLSGHPHPKIPMDFERMVEKSVAMVKKSLDALVNMNLKLAEEVIVSDEEVDKINREMYDQVVESVIKTPHHAKAFIHLLSASRHLERIADHATNIAEDVVYLVKGEIIRHRTEEFKG